MTGNKITKSKNFKMTELVRYYRLHYGGFGREVEQLSTLGFFTVSTFSVCAIFLNQRCCRKMIAYYHPLNVKTYQFTTPCKSDEVTHPKQHKSFFSGIM